MSEEVKPDVIQQTQKILGKHVKKPQLTEKLLRKPPFRFLHDVVRIVIQETGFLKGLFSAEELVSDNVKEREKKVAFLNKLIEATKAISGDDLAVKSSKIVAGLEPTQTNLLLQTIGKCIDKKLDSAQYIQQLKQKSKTKTSDVKKVSDSTSKTRQKLEVSKEKIKKESSNKNSISPRKEKVKRESGNKNLISPSSKESKKKTKQQGDASPKKRDDTPEKVNIATHNDTETVVTKNVVEIEENIEKIETEIANDSGDLEVVTENIVVNATKNGENEVVTEPKAVLKRPKSARPKSGDLKQNELEVTPEPLSSNTLRPPSVRPSSARPGAPRLRPDSAIPLKEPVVMGKINVIVENFDKIDDQEEETVVVIENVPEEIKPENELNIPQEKGQLVEEILKQIGDEDVKINNDWQIENFKSKSTGKEAERLRNSIQTLTRIANPFGKLISYLHEDIEAMYNELNMWKNMKRQTYAEIKKHEKIREELCKPLQDQLNNLESAIKKQEEDILMMRAKILRNDTRIKQLLV